MEKLLRGSLATNEGWVVPWGIGWPPGKGFGEVLDTRVEQLTVLFTESSDQSTASARGKHWCFRRRLEKLLLISERPLRELFHSHRGEEQLQLVDTNSCCRQSQEQPGLFRSLAVRPESYLLAASLHHKTGSMRKKKRQI